MTKFLKLTALSLCIFLSACATEPTKTGQSAEELYLTAYRLFNETDYEKAADYFDEIDKQYPYSVWAERAQIMAAYAFYKKNAYDDAILILDRFIQLHPGNRNTPYAYYLKGLCYFEQISDATREQSMTEQAQETFNELIARYPDTVYARDAKTKQDTMTDHLAAQQMVIGRYYLQHNDIVPALNRFNEVITSYAKTNQAPEAYYRLVSGYLMLGATQAAKQTNAVLQKDYPKTAWAEKAQALINRQGK